MSSRPAVATSVARTNSLLSTSFSPISPHLETAWAKIVAKYKQDPSLSEEERKLLQAPSLDDFVGDLSKINIPKPEASRVQRCMAKLDPLLNTLTRFESVIDSFASVDPYGVLCFVWGSVRMVFVVAKDFNNVHEDLVSFFYEIGDSIGRLNGYERLFKESYRFNNALCSVIEDLLSFCTWLRQHFRQNKAKLLAKFIFSDRIKREIEDRIEAINSQCNRTEKEAQLAGAESTVKFQKHAERFFEETRRLQEQSDREAAEREELANLKLVQERLSPLAEGELLDRLRRKRLEGTCAWLLGHEKFSPLLAQSSDSKPRLTWISGLPGSGKTYLSAYIVEKLEPHGPTGFIFCDHKNQSSTSTKSILATWAWQLVRNAKELIGEILGLLTRAAELTRSVMKSILSLISKHHKTSYLVLDGLDECDTDSRADLLETLEEIVGETNIVIVSRPESDIDRAISRWEKKYEVGRISLTADSNQTDIARYIRSSVSSLETRDPALIGMIIDSLVKGAKGIFLYARLMIDELEQTDTDKEKRQILQTIPGGFDALFGRAVERIKKAPRSRRKRIIRLLQLVVCSNQPLTIEELETALAVDTEEGTFDPENTPNTERLISDYCRSLVEYDLDAKTVRVLHSVVQAFLTTSDQDEPFIELAQANSEMAATCLVFLTHEERPFVDRSAIDVNLIPATDPFPFHTTYHMPFWDHDKAFPFLGYCANNWPIHFMRLLGSKDVEDDECLEALRNLFSSEQAVLKWLEMFKFAHSEGNPQARQSAEILEFWVLDHARRQHKDVDLDSDEIGASAIFKLSGIAFAWNGFPVEEALKPAIAASMGGFKYPSRAQLKTIGNQWEQLMTRFGFSSANGICRWQRFTRSEVMTRKPVSLAAQFNFRKFLEKELKSGLSPDEKDVMDRTLLHAACWFESGEMVELLLKRGADVNHCAEFSACDGATPLIEALSQDQYPPVRKRDFATAQFLLDRGAAVQSSIRDLTPLHTMFQWWGESQSDLELLNRIIDRAKGSDKLLETPNPFNGMNSLHIVSAANLDKTLEVLVQRHGEPSKFINLPWGLDGKTALHEACFHCESTAGRKLLEMNAKIDVACKVTLSTPLHLATKSRSDMAAKLIDGGADVDAQDAAGRTPLHFAAAQDWVEGVDLLLKHGGDVKKKDNQGQTVLDAALAMQCNNAAQKLRDAGAEPTKHKVDARSPSSSKAIFEVYSILNKQFKPHAKRARGLAKRQNPDHKHLINRILDLAEYWLKSSTTLFGPMVVGGGDSGRPYMLSRPIRGGGVYPIKMAHVKVASEPHEGPHPPDQGTPRSWTWVSLGTKGSGAGNSGVELGPVLAFNRLKASGVQGHEMLRYAGSGSRDEIASWLGRLKNGNCIAVVPMARHPGWHNTVSSATIDVYTSCLKPC